MTAETLLENADTAARGVLGPDPAAVQQTIMFRRARAQVKSRWRPARGQSGEARKQFFFEERRSPPCEHQKTFVYYSFALS